MAGNAMKKLKAYDSADYLTNDETIVEYLSAALQLPDPDMFLTAVKNVERTRHGAACQGYRAWARKLV